MVFGTSGSSSRSDAQGGLPYAAADSQFSSAGESSHWHKHRVHLPATAAPLEDDTDDEGEGCDAPLLGGCQLETRGVSISIHVFSTDADLRSTTDADVFARQVRLGVNASWAVNVMLLVAKVTVFCVSRSYAVLASAADSLVDLLSQGVLAAAERAAARHHERYPVGRMPLAELSVLCCAAIMLCSTVLVMREALEGLASGLAGDVPVLEVGPTLYGVLGSASALKLGLWLYCRTLRRQTTMVALAEDHLNDVMSNVAAICGAAVSGHVPRLWWVDPACAILFSALIIRNWAAICWEQGQKLIGLEAPEELVRSVEQLVAAHQPRLELGRLAAYHRGSHVWVEAGVVLPPETSNMQGREAALALQHQIEALESVERAFVTVDYTARRGELEHKVERNLLAGEADVMKPHPSAAAAHEALRASAATTTTTAAGAAAAAAAATACKPLPRAESGASSVDSGYSQNVAGSCFSGPSSSGSASGSPSASTSPSPCPSLPSSLPSPAASLAQLPEQHQQQQQQQPASREGSSRSGGGGAGGSTRGGVGNAVRAVLMIPNSASAVKRE